MKVDIDIDGSTNLKCYCTLQFDVKCDHKIRFDVDNLLPVDKHAFLESSRKKVGMDNTWKSPAEQPAEHNFLGQNFAQTNLYKAEL